VAITLPPRGSADVAFLLGEATAAGDACALVARYRRPGAIDEALAGAATFWSDLLGAVQVATPLPELDVLVNGWLPYQTLACRVWARSAFYQSGGAYGFRDQLQDAAALIHLRPAITRAQLLRNAAHQFVEGDVLHWWHPPTGRGTRTRFSDDLLWLPLLTAFYVRTTGDWGVLDESVPFLTARALEPGEDEAYLRPEVAAERASLYEHCCRALDRGMTRGAHGLPLMGTGDWNDGMNRVGREGRGESVWVGFFLYRILEDFAALCERRGDHERLARQRDYQTALRDALETAGWDGGWYRRAYYDDGTPLGSASNQECRIDAIAQAWSVISGAAPRERAEQAMDAAMTHLVSARDGIVRLLAPPFDRDPHDPGYIKGYVLGIRENGGQYTHGALWVVQALAELGRRNEAAETLAMLAPVRHALTADRVATYQVEPYVVAADVYGTPPHVGRGGWTWYTGSAGWMYRIALESILGVRMEEGDTLAIRPCVPDAWGGFTVRLRLEGGATYEVLVGNPDRHAAAVVSAAVDGVPVAPGGDGAVRVPLRRDGRAHRVEVTLG
jgi:cyclic beta-1,2-glucan synthetase